MQNLGRSIAGFTLALLALLALLTAVRAAPPAAGDSPVPSPNGEFVWTPELAPAGPLAIIVSLPDQRVHVYRNGVRIGTSAVSTGRPGYETPVGIYTILQKRREHYSNLYDSAPMPFMQRLTWDGVALHAGSLPGYPASHGCIRLPLEFAERLYAATANGTVVVVADADTFPPSVVSPGMFSPVDATTGAARTPTPDALPTMEWFPERSPTGPLTILLSIADRRIVVLRNAVEIGRSDIAVDHPPSVGTRGYMLLDGTRDEPGAVLSDRPALPWLVVSASDATGSSEETLRAAFASGRISVPRQFAQALYQLLRPGATVVLTDEPLQDGLREVEVLTNEGGR